MSAATTEHDLNDDPVCACGRRRSQHAPDGGCVGFEPDELAWIARHHAAQDAAPAVLVKGDEGTAISVIGDVLSALDPEARDRVLLWATMRFRSPDGDTDDETHTFWLEDLPAKGDRLWVAGTAMTVDSVAYEVAGEVLTWRLASRARVGSPVDDGVPAALVTDTGETEA